MLRFGSVIYSCMLLLQLLLRLWLLLMVWWLLLSFRLWRWLPSLLLSLRLRLGVRLLQLLPA